ncbi:hypothetical protein Bca4012_063178 [Brassica carinata]
MYLKQRLYGYRMNESLSVENNIDEFLRIITDLANVEETVTLDEVINSIHSKQLELGSSGKVSKAQGEVLYSGHTGYKGKNTQKPAYNNKQKNKSVQKKGGKEMFSLVGFAAEKNISKETVLRVIRGIEITSETRERVVCSYWSCPFHMTPRKDWLVDLKECSSGSVRMTNETVYTVEGIGTVKVLIADRRQVLIQNVRYISQFSRNLLEP